MFCIIYTDKPDHLEVRMKNRPAHIEYVLSTGNILAGGPFTDDDGEVMTGSLIVLDTNSREEAENWAANDPYTKAGLFAHIEVRAWSHLIGGLADVTPKA
jgi:uncharacterized protein YciI